MIDCMVADSIKGSRAAENLSAPKQAFTRSLSNLCTMAVTKLRQALIGVFISLGTVQAINSTTTLSTAAPEISVWGRGTLVGNRSEYVDSVYSFKNIPYAGAPTGEYRWRHPQHPSWSEVRDAMVFGLPCPQIGVSEYSEDCLTLNVWTPDNTTINDVQDQAATGSVGVLPTTSNSKLPVYVFFPGGGFWGGAASLPAYDGAGLAAKGIIVVTANYRLGVLGFLAHRELSANSSSGTSGNYGLVDQQAALHWVNENIASFGGDPDSVTIGGQSAGAASMLHHINSPLADGLFTRVIAESGPNC
jgi:carboxylesterase 2